MSGKSRPQSHSSGKSGKSIKSKKSKKSVKSTKSRKSTKKLQKVGNRRSSELSLKSTPIPAITRKVNDLKGDVDSLKIKYGRGDDPNKDKIDQVLCNMKRKLETAERILKIAQNVTNNAASLEITRVLLGRIKAIKKLVKNLKEEKGQLTTHERRCISQMCHQLLSMADEMCHFGDPYRRSSAVKCKVQEEPYWTVIKDCETQVGAEMPDDLPPEGIIPSKETFPINPRRERPSPCSDRPASRSGVRQRLPEQNQPISPCRDNKKKPKDNPKTSADRPQGPPKTPPAAELKSSDKRDKDENSNQVFCSKVISVRPEIETSSSTSFDGCWQALSFSMQPSENPVPFEVVDLMAPRYDFSKSQSDYQPTFRCSAGPPTVAAFSVEQWGSLSFGENISRDAVETEL